MLLLFEGAPCHHHTWPRNRACNMLPPPFHDPPRRCKAVKDVSHNFLNTHWTAPSAFYGCGACARGAHACPMGRQACVRMGLCLRCEARTCVLIPMAALSHRLQASLWMTHGGSSAWVISQVGSGYTRGCLGAEGSCWLKCLVHNAPPIYDMLCRQRSRGHQPEKVSL